MDGSVTPAAHDREWELVDEALDRDGPQRRGCIYTGPSPVSDE